MTRDWNSKTDVKEQKQLPRLNSEAGRGKGGFLRISFPLIFKKTKTKQIKNLGFSEIIFGCCVIVVLFLTIMLFR